jgi:Ca2+-binding RTX toxin-like protein
MLLQISDAVLITGGFSLLLGPVEYVDVVTGLSGAPTVGTPVYNWLTSILVSTEADADGDGWEDDPGNDLLRRSSDYGIIYNLPVRTLQLGITDASVFLGWASGLGAFSLDTDVDFDGDGDIDDQDMNGYLDRAELDFLSGDDPATTEVNEGDRIGLFVSGLRLGMVLADPVPYTSPSHLVHNAVLPHFLALDSFATDAGWVGFEEHFELTLRNVALEINRGTALLGVLPTIPVPTIDWARSFGAAGYEVATGTTEDSEPVHLDYEGTPLVGFSADKVLLQISDAVLITGGFSFRIGPVQLVDVATGLSATTFAGTALSALTPLSLIPTQAAIEALPLGDLDTDLWREDDHSVIHNLRVNTIEFGANDVSVFLGWAPGLGAFSLDSGVGADGVLSRADFDLLTGDDDTTPVYDGDAIGFFVETLDLGMLVMNPIPLTDAALATVNPLLPRLFALNSFATSAAWVGFNEHFELEVRNLAVEVNQGTPWPVTVPGIPNPAVDWTSSFPDEDGPDTESVDTEDEAGYEVRTGTTDASPPVLLAFEGTPLIGVSADKVILQISDAVLLTGSFSFRIGPVQLVDVATGIVGTAPLASPAALNSIPTADLVADEDEDTVMWREDDFSMIHNVRVNTFEFGASAVSAFVGWAPGLGAYDLDHALAADGVLSRADFNTLTGDNAETTVYDGDAIGVFLENLRLGMLVMSPVPLTGTEFVGANLVSPLLPRLIGLDSFASSAAWVGFNEHFELELRNIAVEINQGTPITGVLPGTPNPAVDWKQSFPDSDVDAEGGDGPDEAGYEVRTGTTEASVPVLLDFDGTPLVGFSADKVILQISDAVLITGGFSFRIGPVQLVDVATGLQSDIPLTVGPTALNFIPTADLVPDEDEDTAMWREDDFSMIHNVRVNTLEFGASNVTVFLGWADGLGAYNLDHAAAADGSLSRAEFDALTGDDAIGFFLENLTLGLLLMSPVPLPLGPGNPNAAAINLVLPKLFGMRATADSMGIVGLEDFLELTAEDIEIEINQGSPWLGAIPGMPNPVVDWVHSFPDSDTEAEGGDGPDVDGYEVRTGTTEAAPTVLLDFEGTPLIGVSADAILLQISDFIHVSGAFSFRIGPVRTLDIATGLTTVTCPSAAPILAVTTTASTTEMYRSDDCSMLHNVRMNTIEVGTSGLSVFVGYGPGLSAWNLDDDADGVLSLAEFEALTGDTNTANTEYDGDAVGFFLENLTLGLMMMSPVPLTGLPTVTALNPFLPKLFALKADADSLALIGVPGIELSGTGVRVEVNLGTKIVPSALLPAGVDWLSSFPDTDGPDTEAIDTEDEAGFEVPTGTSTDPVLFDMQGFLIGGGAENVHIEIGDFVYLDGAIYFEYGAVHQVELADALLPITEMLTELGLDEELGDVVGATSKELSFLNIGAKDLQAFFGVNGPYWIDADADGVIDRYPVGDPNAGQIIDAETNDDAIGLVIDDLTFGLSFMTPTNILDPSRYIAIVGEANLIGLVGLEDYIVMRAEDLTLELNISTPLVSGFPLLPVVDFAASFETADGANDGVFGVKTGARDTTTGDDITVDLGMDGLLVRAGVGFVSMNVMDAVTLNGSIGFELGPTTTVTLADGTTKELKLLTIGAANVYAFIGFNGPYVADSNGNGYIDRADFHTNADGSLGAPKLLNDGTGGRPKAVGFAINDLDLGIFVGLEVETGLGDGPAPSLGVYVAGFLDIGSFGVVGLAGLTAIGTLSASFNVGASTSGGFSAIDFATSFPAGSDEENPTRVGFPVFTGDNDNPILLQFDDFLFKIELAGGINLANTFALSGLFSLEIDTQGLKLLTAGQMVIGPDLSSYNTSTGAITGTPMLFIEALGALVINASGIALDIDIDIDVAVPGLDLSVSARVLLNTIGGSTPQEIVVSQRLLDFLGDLASRGGVDASLGAGLLARLTPCSFDAAKRCYTIDHRAPNILHAPTLYNLLHDPSGPITRLAAGPYVVIAMDGTFDFLGFAQGTGLGGIGISSGAFQLYFNVQFSIGVTGIELKFAAEGAIGIESTGVFIDVSVSLDADITSLFHLDVTGDLEIDTRPVGTANDYFVLRLSGRLDVAGLISVRGGLEVRVGGPAQTINVNTRKDGVIPVFYPGGADSWRITIDNLTGDFGPLEITLNGFIQSDGQFNAEASASIELGIDGFGIEGNISAGASLIIVDRDGDGTFGEPNEYRLTFYVSGGVDVEAFGFDVAGADITASAKGFLGESVTINVEVCVDLLFDEACTDFDLFDIQLPATIFPQGPPKLAEFPVGSSVLELNVGANANRRRGDLQGYTAESYRLTQLAPGEVKVELLDASGRVVAWEVFSGVTSITGNFGSENDTFVFLSGATIPVTISGGIGHDVLSYLGSGAATLNGDEGNDTLTGGSGVDVLNGGDNDDYLDGRGGIDTINGGAGNDIIFGLITNLFGATAETLDGGDDTDLVEIVGTTGNDSFTVDTVTSGGVTRLRITYAGASVLIEDAEKILLNPRSGADTIQLTGELEDSGITELKIIMGDGATDAADLVTMTLLGTADVVDLTGGQAAGLVSNVRGDGVLPAPTYTGGASAATVAQTVATWSGHYTLYLNNSGPAQADLFTVQTGDGEDKVQVRTLASNTRIEGGNGDDRISVGSNATTTTNTGGTLDGIDAALTIVGGAPTASDVLLIDDTGDADGETGKVTATTVDGFGLDPGEGITYSEIETLDVNLGSGADTANVWSTYSGAVTTINAGGGADIFNISSDAAANLGNLNSIAGALLILGGTGSDTANISDRSDGGVSDTGTLAVDTLTGYSPATITYQQIETLNLDLGVGATNLTIVSPGATTVNVNAGSNGDVVLITSIAAGTTVTVNGENTADQIVVASNDGTLIINGNAGDDDITVNSSAGTITINGDAGKDFVKIVGLTGTGTVNGGTEDDDVVVRNLTGTLTVDGGTENDWVGILATGAASTLTVHGGDGDDVFEVGSNAEVGTTSATRRALDEGGIVDGVQGIVTINGDAPSASDYLYVDDTGDDAPSSGETGFLTSTRVYGLGMGTGATDGITYGAIEHLEISLGNDSTTFNVLSTNAGTDSLLETGGGDDTINVSSTAPTLATGTVDLIAGHLTVRGEDGSDTMHVSDAGDDNDNTGNLKFDTLTGLDMGAQGITYGTLELLDIDLGSGDDTFLVESTHLTQTSIDGAAGTDAVNIRTIDGHTIVTGGADADTITVGTLAPAMGGTLDDIDALLELIGNDGDDSVVADDTGDAGSNVGVVTTSTIEGLGMTVGTVGSTTATTPSSVVHRITIANAFDGTFTITIGGKTTAAIDFDASADAVRQALLTALAGTPGLDASDIQISRVLHDLELTFVIAFVGDLTGAAGHDLGALSVNGSALLGLADYGDAIATSASSTTGLIVYTEIEDLDVLLGDGVDVLHVRSTHTGSTDVGGGDANDVLLVETIAGTTVIEGEDGDDTLVINPLAGVPASTNGFGDEALTVDGNEGSDLYVVNIWSSGTSELSIHDSGVDPSGTDRLTINGTDGADTFLLRAGYVAALTNKVGGAFLDAEHINYDNTIDAGITINTLGGADLVAFDDNSSLTTVNGGDGDDRFQVGQLFGDDPDDSDDLVVDTATVHTTRGELSNGVSEATTINGGAGNDQFQIFHNLGVLQLNGDTGDDTFIIRTFLGIDGGTGIDAGLGRDLIDYIWNAPVSIDGGDGFDTVVIIGTEAGDEFVITADGVYGAGRFVAFTGVEQLDVDGAEGDDIFNVLSTAPGVLVRIFGGLGSDLVNVGGDANAVYGDDLQGHTGLIAHSVESMCAAGAAAGCGAFDDIAVDGVAGEILDDEEPLVIVVQTGGGTTVSEQGTTDTYLVVLNQAPTAEVRVTVSAPSRSPEAELHRSYSIEVSLDGINWHDAVTLVFDAGSWSVPQTIWVRAHGDLSSEGERSAALQHLVVSSDDAYDGLPINNVVVRLIDDEQAGLVLIESGVDTVVTEEGPNDTYTIGLTRAPLTSVTVTITGDAEVCVASGADTDGNDTPADLCNVTLVFTPSSWAAQTITVRGADDSDVESFHFGYVRTGVSSTFPGTEIISGTVTAVNGTRITITSGTPFDANALRGYLLRLTSGDGAGQSWAIWGNLASTGGSGAYVTVITVQGAVEIAPALGDRVYINGYVAPVLTEALTGTITHVGGVTGPLGTVLTGTSITVGSLSTPLPTANGGLSGALIRIFNADGTTEYRRIASNTATTITLDSAWTLKIGQQFSVLDLEGVSIPLLPVLVADDDTPGVLITQTDGSTNVAEGATSPTLGLLYDTYTVVLTRAPVAGETVTVWITPTTSETLHQPDGAAGYRTRQQLCASTSAPAAGADCTGAAIALTFTAASWNIAQTVYVWAKPDDVLDGSDLQDFADSAQRVHLIQGPLHVDGGGDEYADRSIPEPILLPGESSGPLPTPPDPAFDAIEDRQVDTLVVHNEDSVSDDTGLLTSTRLSGLGMGPDQFVGGRFLDGGISYDDLEALRILLGQGDDTLTIASTHGGTTVITGSDGDDTFRVDTISGHTNISGDADDDTFEIGTYFHTLDDLDSLLVIDGGAGSDDAVVDDTSDPDANDNLGTLTQTTITGLEMVSGDLDRLFSLTIGSTTTHVTFTITIPGRASPVVLTLAVAGLTAESLAAALQTAIFPVTGTPTAPITGCGAGGDDAVTPALDTPCSRSVFVWGHGGDYLIGFQGELHDLAVGLSVISTDAAGEPAPGTATDLARMDGINYYGFDTSELLTILLGAGDDRFNVRGTLPHTVLDTGAGDDVVFVSDSADLGGLEDALEDADGSLTSVHDDVLHGHLDVDDLDFEGSLDLIDGDLDIDTGGGSNTLAVSDRDDADADTDAELTDGSLTGFADGDIAYTATGGDLAGQGKWTLLHDAGMFGRGITVHAGTGGDTITIASVRGGALASSPLQLTITTLYANDGDDTVVVTAPEVAGGRLVIHGEDGDDTIDAQGGSAVASLPLIVFGGDGDDTIQGGSGADVLFGDHGRVFLFDDGAGFDVILGGNPTPIPDNVLPGGSSLGQNQPDDEVFETIDVVMSLYEDETDDDDIVRGGDGDDLVIGGVGSDALDGEDDRDIVVGDQAIFTRNESGLSPITRELVGTTLYGGVQVDHQLDPNMGPLAWTITLLDHSTGTPGHLYGDDVAAGGSDEDLVFGQLGDDTLHGDGVLVTDEAGWSIDPNGSTADDADDHIEGGGGDDTVHGGLGQDSILGGSSDLFGLVTQAQRPDGVDTVFGGNGDLSDRNDLGDGLGNGRDADVILGDNGRIFRIITTAGPFAQFNYDLGTIKVIPRVTEHLDYSPIGEDGYWFAPIGGVPAAAVWTVGTGTNIGGGDFLHGESGDDIVHGQTGDDAIFGEAHDDDLYGEAGEDWISGGTGDDGIVTDDGRIYTRRNSTAFGEPLYGLTALPCTSTPGTPSTNPLCRLETPGDMQIADLYFTGELHKSVELDLAIPGVTTFTTFYVGTTDIAYGGWGNDFIHGGEGDDALSGAEALELYYTLDPWETLRSLDYMVDDPTNHRGVLQWGVARELEFLEYDEFDPWERVTIPTGEMFLLVNDAAENGAAGDGKDTIFGDGGNDWMVGGTNHDRLFGGWGDDLLSADDDPATNSGANDAPDVQTGPPTYADIAYGGAGRDILIGNTGADRLIDWVGEFNSYVVPFSPFGAATISRSNSPALRQYLLDLGRGSGADITRGGDATRYGEPFGELGMVIQQDPWWGDQTGAPGDPQPGNSHGKRDVLRTESFTNAPQALAAFAVDSGTWRVLNGRYESVAVTGQDAASIFYVDAQLPRYHEILARVNSDKAKAGYRSNAYVLFDYQHSTDFKFAGIEIGTSKVRIGRRTASGWQVLAQANWTLLANRDYDLMVVVDGQTVTLYVDGVAALSYTFSTALLDASDPSKGYADPINDGLIGVGSDGAIMRLGSMSVRTLSPEITFSATEEFNGSPGHTQPAGSWSLSGGVYRADPGAGAALSLTALEVAPSARLMVETRLRTSGMAGIALDHYAASRFKFVVVDVAGGRISIGHRTADGWFTDAFVTRSLSPSAWYRLRVELDDQTVIVSLDGVEVLRHRFNSLVNDGAIGLFARSAPAEFEAMTIETDDPDLTPPLPFASVGDAAVTEADSSTTVTVTVTLSRASDQPITVTLRTSDLSAFAGSDYVGSTVTVTFAPGETSKTVSLTIVGDDVREDDETFAVSLIDPVGAILGDASGVVTILNDDVASTVSVTATDATATEGGADRATFVIQRVGDLAAPLAVKLAWTGSGIYGVDYTVSVVGGSLSADGQTLTMGAGATHATLTVTALTDSFAEAAESVVLTLGADAAYAVGSPASATATLVDAGSLPAVSVSDGSVTEGRTGVSWVTVTVTLSKPSAGTVTVQLRTYDGTARAGQDYRSEVTTLTFAPGQTSLTFSIRVLGDRDREGNETFTVELSTPTGAVIGDGVGLVTIVDDDGGTMLAASAPTGSARVAPLTKRSADSLLDAAIAWWVAQGIDPALLATIDIVITDLPGLTLARADGTTIYLDRDAAGHGWFVDPTPEDASEFVVCSDGSGWAPSGSPAAGRMDLLTVLRHEVGHVVGLDDEAAESHEIMSADLAAGERLLA